MPESLKEQKERIQQILYETQEVRVLSGARKKIRVMEEASMQAAGPWNREKIGHSDKSIIWRYAMGKIDRQHKNIKKAGRRLDIEFAQTAHGLEDQLKTMGIVIPRTVPRIPAPYHTRGEDARRVKDPRSTNHPLHQIHKAR